MAAAANSERKQRSNIDINQIRAKTNGGQPGDAETSDIERRRKSSGNVERKSAFMA